MDHGLASLYDVAGLAMMWSVLNAWLQGTAMLRTAGVDAETYAPFAQQIAAGVAGWLPGYAEQIDSGRFPAEVSALQTDARATTHLIEESEAVGVNAELPKLIKAMADGSVAAGHGGEMNVSLQVLVEGASDGAAVETLAARRGLDLAGLGVAVVPMGGAGGAYRAIAAACAARAGVCGLYDVGELGFVTRALVRHGLATRGDRAELAALGFHACERDLEDELIRALGIEAMLAVVEQQGDLDRFRTFSAQPEWRGRPAADRLHRFCGTTAGRKKRYGRALAVATPAEPPPIRALLDTVVAQVGGSFSAPAPAPGQL